MPSKSPLGGSREHGFTLIETMVVLAVLGLMLGLVIGRVGGASPALTARATAELLASSLRAARARAIAGDRPIRVAIAGGALLADGQAPRRLPSGLAITAAPIVFAADGSASGGTIAVAGGDRRYSVAVDWLTGETGISQTTIGRTGIAGGA